MAVIDRIAAFITGEGNWLPIAMTLAAAAVAVRWRRHSAAAHRDRVMEAMNLFVGTTLLVMGSGHLLAVSLHHVRGDLNGPAALLYAIGLAIVIPSAVLVRRAPRTVAALNGWMAATLVVLGLINIPLAIPALLNIAYSRARGRAATAVVVAFVMVNLALFAGGMLFMLSGARTFEEFQPLSTL